MSHVATLRFSHFTTRKVQRRVEWTDRATARMLVPVESQGVEAMRRITLALSVAALVVGTTGCPEKGPMEKAGEKVDDTVDKLTHPNEGPLERAGRKLDEQIDKAKDAVTPDD
jgi:predicted small lipoprotein YifL